MGSAHPTIRNFRNVRDNFSARPGPFKIPGGTSPAVIHRQLKLPFVGVEAQTHSGLSMEARYSGKIAEAVSGIHEIQGNAAFRIEFGKFDVLANKLMKIRIAWNLYRQGMKVGSNFFSSISPFVIFLLGGWLAINGKLELGSLVAFLSAQEKLFGSWRELIDVYQSYQEASVSYRRTMEYFDEEPEFKLEPQGREPYQLDGRIEVQNLSFKTDSDVQLLNDINFSVKSGEQVALVGFSGSGKSTLAQNLTFGFANDESFNRANLSKNEYFRRFMDEYGLTGRLLELGMALCEKTVDILGNLAPDRSFFEQCPIKSEELDDYKILQGNLKTKAIDQITAAERQQIMELALRFVPGKHKMVALTVDLQRRVLAARIKFRQRMSADQPGPIHFTVKMTTSIGEKGPTA